MYSKGKMKWFTLVRRVLQNIRLKKSFTRGDTTDKPCKITIDYGSDIRLKGLTGLLQKISTERVSS